MPSLPSISSLGKANIEWFVGHYLNSMDEAKDARMDIVGAADLADLPSITIISAEIDPLRSEGEALRNKLEEAGNDLTYQSWNGVTQSSSAWQRSCPMPRKRTSWPALSSRTFWRRIAIWRPATNPGACINLSLGYDPIGSQ